MKERKTALRNHFTHDVTLYEGGKVVKVVEAGDEESAKHIVESWEAGTYQLLEG